LANGTAVDTGQTYGARLSKMGTDGRADWLRSGELTVYFARGDVDQPTAVRDGVSLVLVWHDDEDTDAAA